MAKRTKQPKLVKGQMTLFGIHMEPADISSSDMTAIAKRRGMVDLWRCFGQAKWRTKYPWLNIRHDGVYCLYCEKGATSGVLEVVVSLASQKALHGNTYNVLQRHESQSITHFESSPLYRESLECPLISDLLARIIVLPASSAEADP